MRVACGQVEARDLNDASRALEEALAMCDAAGAVGAELFVLPEGTYPAYVMGSVDAARRALADGVDAEAAFAAKAAQHGMAMVVGLIVDSPSGLLNAAVHIDATGAVRSRTGKQFLWHFDRAWFVSGGAGEVVDGIGTLVCADGRLPEISNRLVQRGARLLVNSTAWVTPMAPPSGTNPQAEFLWRVRALESGVPAVAATKVGTEAAVCTYAGRSQIVAADGRIVAIASATQAEVLVGDVEIPDDAVAPFFDDVALPSPPIAPPLRPGHAYCVVVSDEALLQSLDGHGAAVVVGPGGVVRADDVSVECVVGDAMLVPGPARAAAMRGCEFVAWIARDVSSAWVEEVAMARAMENRIFVATWRDSDHGGPFIVNPAGRVIARTPHADRPFAVGASCLLAEAATKQMAPGTDVWVDVQALRH
jgi:predicted amidohydrolase